MRCGMPCGRCEFRDSDDLLRRELIKQLICNFKLDKRIIEQQFGVRSQYFKHDLALLQTFIDDQLVVVDDQYIELHFVVVC